MSLLVIFLSTLAGLVSILLYRHYAVHLEARIAAETSALRSTVMAELADLQSALQEQTTTLRWSAIGESNSLRADLEEIRQEIALVLSDMKKLSPAPVAAGKPASISARKRKPPLPETSLSRPVPSASPSSHPADPAA